MSSRMPEYMSDRLPDRMPEHMSDRMPEYMPDRMSEYMSDKLSEYIEYMSKYTSWNVMVGITRITVFYFTKSHECVGLWEEKLPAASPKSTHSFLVRVFYSTHPKALLIRKVYHGKSTLPCCRTFSQHRRVAVSSTWHVLQKLVLGFWTGAHGLWRWKETTKSTEPRLPSIKSDFLQSHGAFWTWRWLAPCALLRSTLQ